MLLLYLKALLWAPQFSQIAHLISAKFYRNGIWFYFGHLRFAYNLLFAFQSLNSDVKSLKTGLPFWFWYHSNPLYSLESHNASTHGFPQLSFSGIQLCASLYCSSLWFSQQFICIRRGPRFADLTLFWVFEGWLAH